MRHPSKVRNIRVRPSMSWRTRRLPMTVRAREQRRGSEDVKNRGEHARGCCDVDEHLVAFDEPREYLLGWCGCWNWTEKCIESVPHRGSMKVVHNPPQYA